MLPTIHSSFIDRAYQAAEKVESGNVFVAAKDIFPHPARDILLGSPLTPICTGLSLRINLRGKIGEEN